MYPIKKILVPTDFSRNAAAAYHPAQQLAEKLGAKVDFIHIIPNHNYFTESITNLGSSLNWNRDLYSKLQEEASTKLDKLVNSFIDEENKGACHVELAPKPSKAIADKATNGGYDLIVMAAKGEHASDFWAGSTTKRVIRYSKIPVFSTEKSYIDGFQNILVPTDGTPESLQALPMAVSIADAFKATITMYHVIVLRRPLLEESSNSIPETMYQQIQEEVFSEMGTFFSGFWDSVSLQRNENGKSQLLYKKDDSEVTIAIRTVVQQKMSKYDAITDYARENADIMIMATHGRQGLAHFVFGSVSEEVAHALKLPVITTQSGVDNLV